MLPLIGGFVLSLAGSFIGKALANVFSTPKTAAAKPPGAGAADAAPFSSVLAQESKRYAQAPGLTATDAAVGSAALLPPASPHVLGRLYDDFQAP